MLRSARTRRLGRCGALTDFTLGLPATPRLGVAIVDTGDG
jgi:hypothetical protein